MTNRVRGRCENVPKDSLELTWPQPHRPSARKPSKDHLVSLSICNPSCQHCPAYQSLCPHPTPLICLARAPTSTSLFLRVPSYRSTAPQECQGKWIPATSLTPSELLPALLPREIRPPPLPPRDLLTRPCLSAQLASICFQLLSGRN